MRTFMELLEEYPLKYWDFRRFLRWDTPYYEDDMSIDNLKKASTGDRCFSSLIEQWLETRGFVFRIEFDPLKSKVRYVIYYKSIFFDMGEDELKSLEGMKDTYMVCVKAL